MKNCLIKWTGSKRHQANEIIKYFPEKIDIYYEPFIGGGSVLYSLLSSDIEVKNYVCSDINEDLIKLWNCVKSNPELIIKKYKDLWLGLNIDNNIDRQKEYFYNIRKEFNKNRKPELFMFLTRTSMNGLIRYNSKGEFNSSFHFGRPGINPDTLKDIINHWSFLLNKNNVIFINRDYREITPNKNDLIYLDPPYENTKGMYFGKFDYIKLCEWIKKINCSYLISFNGIRGDIDTTVSISNDLYDKHLYLNSGNSSFARMKNNKKIVVKESLYIKLNKE